MALPPIITNSPLFRVLSGSQPRSASEAAEKPVAQKTGDRVDLSSGALQKLEEDDLKAQDQARNSAAEVRNVLERNPAATLGLDLSASL